MRHHTCTRLWFALTACMALLGATSGMHAQSNNGTIAGTVNDVAGKPIPNAAVSVKNESSGPPRTVVADQEGKFSIPGLPAGVYTLEASAPSFASSRRTGLKLAAGGSENITISLNVGELSQT